MRRNHPILIIYWTRNWYTRNFPSLNVPQCSNKSEEANSNPLKTEAFNTNDPLIFLCRHDVISDCFFSDYISLGIILLQKLYRFINCVELVSPHHAARELVNTIRQGHFTSLFQKSVKRVRLFWFMVGGLLLTTSHLWIAVHHKSQTQSSLYNCNCTCSNFKNIISVVNTLNSQ